MLNASLQEKIVKILRSTEKYTKTDMVYLAREGFWSLSNQVIGSLSSFLVVVILANLLPKETFGQYRFVLSIISVLLIFTLPGIDTSMTRAVAKKHIVNFSKILKTKIYWGFLGSLATFILAGYYFYKGNTELVYILFLVGIFLPFIEAFSIYTSYFKGKQDFKTSAIYESVSRIFQALLLVIIALITTNILVLIGAFLLGQLIARFFFYRKTLRDEKLYISSSNISVSEGDDTIEYGKRLSATQIVNTITGNIDKILVWHFLGAEMLAIYYIALTIPRNLVLIFNIIPRIALPKFSQNNWEVSERPKVIRKIYLFFIALIIPALIYSILIPFVLPIIFKDYQASINISVMVGLLIVISPVNALIDRMLQALKAIKRIVFLQVLAFLVFTIMFLFLNKNNGASVMTAALSLIASETAVLILGIFFIKNIKPR